MALELALAGVPMVVAYRLNPLTEALLDKLLHVRRYCLVNLLLDQPVVPELVRGDCNPERIAAEWWRNPDPETLGDPHAIRDYYRVEDTEGRRFWLYRAGLPGDPPPRWFVHGIFA